MNSMILGMFVHSKIFFFLVVINLILSNIFCFKLFKKKNNNNKVAMKFLKMSMMHLHKIFVIIAFVVR